MHVIHKELFEMEKKIHLTNKDFYISLQEKRRLAELAKKVGLNYSWILVCFMEWRKSTRDSKFFEEYFVL